MTFSLNSRNFLGDIQDRQVSVSPGLLYLALVFVPMQNHLLLKDYDLRVNLVESRTNSLFFLKDLLSLPYFQVPNLRLQFDHFFLPLGDPFLNFLPDGTGCRQETIAGRSPNLEGIVIEHISSVHRVLIR